MSQVAREPVADALVDVEPMISPVPEPRGAHRAATAPRAATVTGTAVEIAVEHVDDLSGMRLRQVVLADESDDSPTREANQAAIEVLDDMLRAHPEWPEPRVQDGELVTCGNPTAQWVYESAAMREWRTCLVPGAIALYPVQRPLGHLPSGAPVDEMTRRVLVDSIDAIGIRTRARIMAEIARSTTVAALGADPQTDLAWVSLACGAAVPVLDALASLGSDAGRVHLRLVDLDAGALTFADQLAVEQGLHRGRDYELLHRDLVRTLVAGTGLVDEIGEGSAVLVEALGIFEYFSDTACTRLLHHAYRMVAPGGTLVVGNMLAGRPQWDFNQRAAGWPRLYPRSVQALAGLVQRAGLPLERTTVTIAQDGVYAVVSVER